MDARTYHGLRGETISSTLFEIYVKFVIRHDTQVRLSKRICVTEVVGSSMITKLNVREVRSVSTCLPRGNQVDGLPRAYKFSTGMLDLNFLCACITLRAEFCRLLAPTTLQ